MKVQIEVDEDLWKQAKMAAAATTVSVSSYVEGAIRDAIVGDKALSAYAVRLASKLDKQGTSLRHEEGQGGE